MDIAIVNPNWRKNVPDVPGIKLTGMNTDIITNVMDTIAPDISFMASIDALTGDL